MNQERIVTKIVLEKEVIQTKIVQEIQEEIQNKK